MRLPTHPSNTYTVSRSRSNFTPQSMQTKHWKLTDCCSILIALGIFKHFCLSACGCCWCCSPFPLPNGVCVEPIECFRISCESDRSGDDNWLFAQFDIANAPPPPSRMLCASPVRGDFKQVAVSKAGEFWFIFGQFGWWHLMRCGDRVNVSAFGRRSSSWFLYLFFFCWCECPCMLVDVSVVVVIFVRKT